MLLPLRFTGVAHMTLEELVPRCNAWEESSAPANLASADMRLESGTATEEDFGVQGCRSDRKVMLN
jgi:hypothetical protein